MIKPCLILLMIMVACPALALEGGDPVTMLLKANESYQQGDYAQAEGQYKKILDAGMRNGRVYYNLGNALFRQGKTGEAIQNYLLARQLMPRNEDLEANLGYARQKAEDRTETSSVGVIRSLVFWYDWLTIREMAWGFLLCNLFFWAGLGIRLYGRHSAVIGMTLVSLACGIILGGTVAVRVVSEQFATPAVIIAREIPVRSGMDPNSSTLFMLHEGAEVTIEKEHEDWFLIHFSSGRKGWVRKEQIGLAVL